MHAPDSIDAADLRLASENATAPLHALMMEAQRAVQTILPGDHRQKKPGAGERFWQFRDYTPSDRPQDIDWRQSAKGDAVFVREKEKQNAQTVLLWRSSGAGMDFSSSPSLPTKKHAANVLTLGLAMLLARGHELAGLIGGSFFPGRTEKTIQFFAEDLLHTAAPGFLDLGRIPQKKDCSLILIGDFLDDLETLDSVLRALRQSSARGAVVQVLDPAEIDLPYDGRIVFETPASGIREKIDNVAGVRHAYRERVAAHLSALKNICAAMGWEYALHPTQTPPGQTLFTLWGGLSARALAYGGTR